MAEFRMPALGADMEAGTLVEWFVKSGDTVQRGDIVAAVDTEKATIEVEVFEDGVIDRILVGEGEHVPVGTPLAILSPPGRPPEPEEGAVPEEGGVPGEPEKAVVAPREAPPPSPLVRRLAEDLHVDVDKVTGSGAGGRITRRDVERVAKAPVPAQPPSPAAAPAPPMAPAAPAPRASPRARRAAAALGVDLSTVRGSGPRGSITGEDVERAAVAKPAAQARPEPSPAPAVQAPVAPADRQAARRAATARLMSRSNRDIPHFYLGQDIEVSRALEWLESENLRRPVRERILPAALLLKATALAARDVPDVNGFWIGDRFDAREQVDLGVAISLREGGLVTPAIQGADGMSLGDLMAAFHDLVARARKGRLRGSELSAGTLTVTNLGEQGVHAVYGVIYPPQVALVGFGRITERAWAAHGMVGARPVVVSTLSADHRAIDGRVGALFLNAIDKHLQEPEKL